VAIKVTSSKNPSHREARLGLLMGIQGGRDACQLWNFGGMVLEVSQPLRQRLVPRRTKKPDASAGGVGLVDVASRAVAGGEGCRWGHQGLDDQCISMDQIFEGSASDKICWPSRWSRAEATDDRRYDRKERSAHDGRLKQIEEAE